MLDGGCGPFLLANKQLAEAGIGKSAIAACGAPCNWCRNIPQAGEHALWMLCVRRIQVGQVRKFQSTVKGVCPSCSQAWM